MWTPTEYGETRDIFTQALNALREVEGVFAETPFDTYQPHELGSALDEGGHWLTGSDLYELERAIELMERLTGRAHSRSIPASERYAA